MPLRRLLLHRLLVQAQTLLLSGSTVASRTLPAHRSVWMECSHLPLPEPHQGLAQVMQHLANNREASHTGIQGSHFRELGKACIQHSPRSQRRLPFLLKTPGTPWGRQRSPSRAPSVQTGRLTCPKPPGQAMPFPKPWAAVLPNSRTEFPQCRVHAAVSTCWSSTLYPSLVSDPTWTSSIRTGR